MAFKRLTEQLKITHDAMIKASVTRSKKNLDHAFKEYGALHLMLDKLMSFVEHRWMVKLFTTGSSVEIKIEAEHLEEAHDIAIELVDTFSEVIRFELYCDGIQIPDDKLM